MTKRARYFMIGSGHESESEPDYEIKDGEVNVLLPSISDTEIDKLYISFSDLDPKQKQFKGSKREYVANVTMLITKNIVHVTANSPYNFPNKKNLVGGMTRDDDDEDEEDDVVAPEDIPIQVSEVDENDIDEEDNEDDEDDEDFDEDDIGIEEDITTRLTSKNIYDEYKVALGNFLVRSENLRSEEQYDKYMSRVFPKIDDETIKAIKSDAKDIYTPAAFKVVDDISNLPVRLKEISRTDEGGLIEDPLDIEFRMYFDRVLKSPVLKAMDIEELRTQYKRLTNGMTLYYDALKAAKNKDVELQEFTSRSLNFTMYPYLTDFNTYNGLGTLSRRFITGAGGESLKDRQTARTAEQGKIGEFMLRSDKILMKRYGFRTEIYNIAALAFKQKIMESDALDLQDTIEDIAAVSAAAPPSDPIHVFGEVKTYANIKPTAGYQYTKQLMFVHMNNELEKNLEDGSYVPTIKISGKRIGERTMRLPEESTFGLGDNQIPHIPLFINVLNKDAWERINVPVHDTIPFTLNVDALKASSFMSDIYVGRSGDQYITLSDLMLELTPPNKFFSLTDEGRVTAIQRNQLRAFSVYRQLKNILDTIDVDDFIDDPPVAPATIKVKGKNKPNPAADKVNELITGIHEYLEDMDEEKRAKKFEKFKRGIKGITFTDKEVFYSYDFLFRNRLVKDIILNKNKAGEISRTIDMTKLNQLQTLVKGGKGKGIDVPKIFDTIFGNSLKEGIDPKVLREERRKALDLYRKPQVYFVEPTRQLKEGKMVAKADDTIDIKNIKAPTAPRFVEYLNETKSEGVGTFVNMNVSPDTFTSTWWNQWKRTMSQEKFEELAFSGIDNLYQAYYEWIRSDPSKVVSDPSMTSTSQYFGIRRRMRGRTKGEAIDWKAIVNSDDFKREIQNIETDKKQLRKELKKADSKIFKGVNKTAIKNALDDYNNLVVKGKVKTSERSGKYTAEIVRPLIAKMNKLTAAIMKLPSNVKYIPQETELPSELPSGSEPTPAPSPAAAAAIEVPVIDHVSELPKVKTIMKNETKRIQQLTPYDFVLDRLIELDSKGLIEEDDSNLVDKLGSEWSRLIGNPPYRRYETGDEEQKATYLELLKEIRMLFETYTDEINREGEEEPIEAEAAAAAAATTTVFPSNAVVPRETIEREPWEAYVTALNTMNTPEITGRMSSKDLKAFQNIVKGKDEYIYDPKKKQMRFYAKKSPQVLKQRDMFDIIEKLYTKYYVEYEEL